MNRISAYLKKDGWLLAALGLCVGLCLLLSSAATATGSEEDRISRVLSSIKGAGTVKVALHYEDAVPCGAVILAQGAEDISVRLRLISAIQKLLGIAQERIAIYPLEGST